MKFKKMHKKILITFVEGFCSVVPHPVFKYQVVLLQTAHSDSWTNTGVLLGGRMCRERGSFRNN